jgi:hypothetical protein
VIINLLIIINKMIKAVMAKQARGLARGQVRCFSSIPPQEEGEQPSIKSSLGGLVFSGIQSTLSIASEVKEYLQPEDLQQ